MDIYNELIEKGLHPRPIFFSREDEKKFYERKRG